jgi:hypothetical protein
VARAGVNWKTKLSWGTKLENKAGEQIKPWATVSAALQLWVRTPFRQSLVLGKKHKFPLLSLSSSARVWTTVVVPGFSKAWTGGIMKRLGDVGCPRACYFSRFPESKP